MTDDTSAPDGTPLEVQRNFGKPTRAQELAKALAEARKAKKAGKPAGRSTGQAETIVAPAAAPSTSKMEKLAKEGLKPADPDGSAEPKAVRPAPFPAKAPRPSKEPSSALSMLAPSTERTEPTETISTASVPSLGSVDGPSVRESSSPPVRAPRKGMQVRFTGMKPIHVVEAALFAAGKPVAVEEVAEQTGLPPDKVKDGLKELQAAYQGRDTVLEVGKAGTKWAMQVRSQAAEPAAKFAPMEIAPKLLKTLALIAFHQPMKQSLLVDMMGSKVYDHIPELVQRGLVRAREEGPTKILATTALFPEYFGLDAGDPEEVRALMGRLVGIEAPPRPKPETVYEEPQPQEPEPAAAAPAQEAPQGHHAP